MRRGGLALVLAGALLLLLALPASAAGETGTIRVTVLPGMAGSTVTLYLAGKLSAGGLQLTEAFGGGYITGRDIQTRELTQWLADRAEGGTGRQISRDGTVMFTGLEEGVYLLTQKEAAAGYYAMTPMLIVLPEEDGTWYAQAYPKVEPKDDLIPETGQPFTPVLWAMGMILSAFAIGIWYENWHKNRRK